MEFDRRVRSRSFDCKYFDHEFSIMELGSKFTSVMRFIREYGHLEVIQGIRRFRVAFVKNKSYDRGESKSCSSTT